MMVGRWRSFWVLVTFQGFLLLNFRWKFLCKDSSTNRRPSSNTSTTSILFSFFLGWEAIHWTQGICSVTDRHTDMGSKCPEASPLYSSHSLWEKFTSSHQIPEGLRSQPLADTGRVAGCFVVLETSVIKDHSSDKTSICKVRVWIYPWYPNTCL